MKTIDLVAGARPNFMKIAPIVRALQARRSCAPASTPDLGWRIVHTGQHWDREMNDVFFEELGIPAPDVRLGVGSGTHAEQTARVMTAYETLCLTQRPDCTLVVGDVNSTLACALVAAKLRIPVAHVEAGLRSGDRTMPEEINRLATDAVSDLFFVTETSAHENLLREGHPNGRIHVVGNVMVDTLLHQRALLDVTPLGDAGTTETFGMAADWKATVLREAGRYGVVTLHRPSNVDSPETLAGLVDALREISAVVPLAFPVHPRTRATIDRAGLVLGDRIVMLPPLPYMAFLALWKDAALVLTDSGGLQEETTALGVRCITLRDNTERPVTIALGSNVLAGTRPDRIVAAARQALDASGGVAAPARRPPLWDGYAAERIVEVLARVLS